MNGQYLLDTNVLIELIRWNPLGQAIELRFQILANPQDFFISVVTLGEVHSLSRQFGWGANRIALLKAILGGFIVADINYPEVIEAYAEIDAHSCSIGRNMGENALWIAATVRAVRGTLLTSDTDFNHLVPGFIRCVWIDPANPSGGTP